MVFLKAIFEKVDFDAKRIRQKACYYPTHKAFKDVLSLMVYLREFFEKVNFAATQQTTKTHVNSPSVSRVKKVKKMACV